MPQETINRYTVKKGDSFYLISHRLGVPLRALLEANAAINPSRLMVGDVLIIPGEEPREAPPTEKETTQVTVAEGETIADIQLAHNMNLHTLQMANPDQDLNELAQGQVLNMPDESLACALPDSYCLLEGENLEAVALKFNAPIAALLRANPCLAPGDFAMGVSVMLPK